MQCDSYGISSFPFFTERPSCAVSLPPDMPGVNGSESDRSDDSSNDEIADDVAGKERIRWGGDLLHEWKKEDTDNLVKCLLAYGYGRLPWDDFKKSIEAAKSYSISEVKKNELDCDLGDDD
jgi:hypothetical protein